MAEFTRCKPGDRASYFAEGIAKACELLELARAAREAEETGASAACRRPGAPQFSLLRPLLAALQARPELIEGIDAAFTDVLAYAVEDNDPVWWLRKLTLADFTGSVPRVVSLAGYRAARAEASKQPGS